MINRSLLSWLAIVVPPGIVAGGLVSCGAESASGSAEPTPAVVVPEPEIAGPEPPVNIGFGDAPDELPEGSVRVTGVVFSRRESPFQQIPFDRGTLVAVPRATFEALRARTRGPMNVKLVMGGDFPMPKELLEDPDVVRIDLLSDGTFALTMRPGEYVFCLGNLGTVAETDPGAVWVETMFHRTITDEEVQAIVPVLNRKTGDLFLY